ncbi:MAG TPA: Ppx/GppA family phosphatase [Micromonosporaceae bacterium]|nr:Ppx/GppA family phosphatase [Micromonosporaceae bacterium]
MRLAVLDVGSNAANLHVADTAADFPPVPVFQYKASTLLADSVTDDGAIDPAGVDRVERAVVECVEAARRFGVSELIPLATATIRDATNAAQIRERVRRAAGVELRSFTGEDEARLTFLAVRHWQGCRPGPILLLDIGGASMEIACGTGEQPDLAVSLPLGAGRLTRRLLPSHPAGRREVDAVRRRARETVRPVAEMLCGGTPPRQVIGTSKTFKQLARVAGAPAWRQGPAVRRRVHLDDLRAWVPRLAEMSADERAHLPGVSPTRSRQILAGAVTAATVMQALDVEHLDVCPWALREGILLRRIGELTR